MSAYQTDSRIDDYLQMLAFLAAGDLPPGARSGACRRPGRDRDDQKHQAALFYAQRQHLRAAGSERSINLIIRRIGADAHLELSAHVLRHTCLTNLVRRGNNLVLVAEIAEHKRLETTRRYSLPSVEESVRAMEGMCVGH